MREVQTPLEKYEQKTKKIENLVAKGALTQEQGNRAMRAYKKELEQTTKRQTKFNSTLSRTKKIIAGLAAGLTLAKFLRETREAFSRIDALAKQSKTLNLGTGQLLRIQEAGALSSGLGEGQINNALEKQAASIGQAVAGRGVGKSRLTQLKLDARELSKLSADEQFLKIADAIKEVNNRTEQVSIVQDLFGRSNAKLVETLRQGSGGILEQTKHLEKRAKYLDENAKRAEASNDAFTRLGSAAKGFFERVAIGASGGLERFADKFEKMVSDGSLGQLAENIGEFAVGTFELMTTLTPVFNKLLSIGNQAFSSLFDEKAVFQRDPKIGEFTRNGNVSQAFFATIGRQAEGIFGGMLGFGPSASERTQARREATRGGGATAAESEAATRRINERILNDPRFAKVREKNFEKRLNPLLKELGSKGEELSKRLTSPWMNVLEGVREKSKDFITKTRQDLQKSGREARQERLQKKLSSLDATKEESQREIDSLTGSLSRRQQGGRTGSLAGKDSIEAFATQFGQGNEIKVVDEVRKVKEEVAKLTGVIQQIEHEKKSLKKVAAQREATF